MFKKNNILIYIAGLISGSILTIFSLVYFVPTEITQNEYKGDVNNRTERVVLDLYPEHFSLLKDSNKWINQLNDAYYAMEDLMDFTPFNGEKIIIKETPASDIDGAELVAGNPVRWADDFVVERINSINNFNDVSYGVIHELGHNFDIPNQAYLEGNLDIINAEQWANLKAIYVALALSKKFPDATFYFSQTNYILIGEIPKKYFFDIHSKEWLSKENKNWKKMPHDAYTGFLYSVVEKYGWDPFKKTFGEYNTYNNFFEPIPTDDLGKIQLFANTLSKYARSGNDIKSRFREWGIPVK